MPAQSEALPNSIDQGGRWFWNFLKQELTPYPGRAWVVGRVTIAATIVMILVMTFQIPGGFQGAIFTLIISRENPTATLLSGFRTAVAFLVGTESHGLVFRAGRLQALRLHTNLDGSHGNPGRRGVPRQRRKACCPL